VRRGGLAVLVLLACACDGAPREAASPDEPPDRAEASPQEATVITVKNYVDTQFGALVSAATELCAAAPEPAEEGWLGEDDAIATMREAWGRARDAYERVEGAVAILFPELDLQIDGRYEHTVELGRDTDPFDGAGFVGLHAVERILWHDAVSPEVRRFEETLAGYWPPLAPRTAPEARQFREGLCRRLVRDTSNMREQFRPLALDHQTAWRGVLGSIEEQAEKVLLHATGQDESRYARRTLADMRANLAGGRAVLDAYAPLLEAHPASAAPMREVNARFGALEVAYGERSMALPDVPEGFDPEAPSREHLATPYGRLFALLSSASDPLEPASLAARLREAGNAMHIAPLARAR